MAKDSFGLGASMLGGKGGEGLPKIYKQCCSANFLSLGTGQQLHQSLARSQTVQGSPTVRSKLQCLPHLRLRACRFDHVRSNKNESSSEPGRLPVHEGWLKGKLALRRYLKPRDRTDAKLDS